MKTLLWVMYASIFAAYLGYCIAKLIRDWWRERTEHERLRESFENAQKKD